MRIIALKAARGWSKAKTPENLFLRPATIAEWTKRVDEGGEDALVQILEPINGFPDFVRCMVCFLKVWCPSMGKKQIAQTLSRAGLRLTVSTVGRMLKERDSRTPKPEEAAASEESILKKTKRSPVEAKYSNHVCQIDLSAP